MPQVAGARAFSCPSLSSLHILLLILWAPVAVASPFIMVGAVQSSSAEFRVRGYSGDLRLTLVDADGVAMPGSSGPVLVASRVLDGNTLIHTSNLAPSSRFHYALYSNTTAEGAEADFKKNKATEGYFSTFPLQGTPSNFTFSVGACLRTGAKTFKLDPPETFDAMAREKPAFFLHQGDLHYDDLVQGTQADFDAAISTTVAAPHFRTLLRSTPIAYIWDDHDFGGNNADSSSASKLASRRSYHANIPHYPFLAQRELDTKSANGTAQEHLAALDDVDDIPIYQAFAFGRVRFLLTDLRSESTVGGDIMSESQMTWLLGEIANASQWGMVVWISTMAWNANTKGWGSFRKCRTRISNQIADYNVTNLLVLAGDFHGMGFDDGTNTDYSDANRGSAAFPLGYVNPLGNMGSGSTPRLSEGCVGYRFFPNFHFATVQIRDMSTELPSNVSTDSTDPDLAAAVCFEITGFVSGERSTTHTFARCTPFAVPDKRSGRGTLCQLTWFPAEYTFLYALSAMLVVLFVPFVLVKGRRVLRLWQKALFLCLAALDTIFVIIVQISKVASIVTTNPITAVLCTCMVVLFVVVVAFVCCKLRKSPLAQEEPESNASRTNSERSLSRARDASFELVAAVPGA